MIESSFGKSGKFKATFRDGAVLKAGTRLTVRSRKYCGLTAKGIKGGSLPVGGAGAASSK